MNLWVRTNVLRFNSVSNLCRYSTSTTRPEVAETSDQVFIDDSDDAKPKELEIEKKRNISRLSAAHHNLVNGRRPYDTPHGLVHLTVKYNRKIYGQYGAASGINPSLCWPTKKDIQETIEFERVAFPFTIPEMIAAAAKKRTEQQLKIDQREKDIAAKFEKLSQWKKDLETKVLKKETEVKAAKEKKERLVEEVRRHFGFKLDPRDERFQEMLTKKEKEQKKLEKMAKKEAKEKMILAKLQQQNVEMNAPKS